MQEILMDAWKALENQTPLAHDCGALCGAACCAPDEDGQNGVYLFPGERALIGDADWAHCVPTRDLNGCDKLICTGPCDRTRRPLGCRIFPLTPVRKGGTWFMRPDVRAWAVCPLMQSGLKGLRPDFVNAATNAIRTLAADPLYERFLLAWARHEKQYHLTL